MAIYNKKSQHEIVGFVVIVVVVAVIGLIFLSFMIGRGDSNNATSVEIENLLSASMYSTSDCAISFVPQYLDIEELIIRCYDNPIGKCLDDRKVCDVLSEELRDIGEVLNIGDGNVNKGLEINVVYKDLESEDSGSEVIPSIKIGEIDECSIKIGASRYVDIDFGSGVVNVELEVCKG